ncbi:hypothetical protein DFJ58DRAFT_807718 [Suillus subalutaceus]|uniref:uncharacterized protein n=1 Tax=Suillus subalutaceus TaxID=48586 RepID=UPI001B87BA00|nr:uncharacterized protein DFJ58DRAFT_807718 [Suillus subalutaceus]KAG1841823.1 hypothetical protein DFJ58DRAFT_807718 [Suillus subalutaceus]
MPHSFVIAKFLPQRSANWTSYYGLEKAASLKTLPFLALRVSRTDVGMQDLGRQGQFLFAISSGKPTGVNDGVIERKTLHVEPSLRPSGRTLYVHTFPRLLEDAQFQISPVTVPHLPHRLDEASFLLAFCGSVLEIYEFLKCANDAHSSGGSEPVEDGWDSWSGKSPYEYEHDRGATFIYQDLLLYNQLAADYSWMGITAAVKWALKSRDHYHAYRVRRGGALLLPGYSFVENFADLRCKPQGTCCNSLVDEDSFDGDPPVADNASETEEVDWDDGPDVDLEFIPNYMPPVPAPSTRAIAFDIFGTILDHHTDAPYNDIVRHALQDVCTVLEAPPSEAVLQEAIQTILQPGLYADAEAAVKTLLIQGYVLVCLPIPGVKSFLLPQLPSGLTLHDQPAPLSDLFGQNHSIFSDLLERCRLKLTSSRYRVMEPASMAGFPTILVQRPGSVDGLQGLQMQLQNLERTPTHVKEFRVCGIQLICFDMTGNVSSACHVLTGSEVAIKMEVPSDSPTATVVLPYEALVGIDRGSHILILDQVGANLQQLRRLCRGELSLKTVVMLAIEMLDRIEFVHSRGVILRDIKPENFAMGVGENSHVVYLFDFGLAKLYDLEALGNVLLFLLHGRLPWQGVYSPSLEAKLLRMGEMKAGSAFRDLLTRSPVEFTTYFDHCRGLKFEDKPNYLLLRQTGGRKNSRFDWEDGSSRKGVLLPDEYKLDIRFTKDDVSTLQTLTSSIYLTYIW